MLTHKQHELLSYIDKKIKDTGISPSFDEMKIALGLKSKSGIHRLIKALEERGFIKRLAHRARALEVTRLPNSLKNDKEILNNIEEIQTSTSDNYLANTSTSKLNNIVNFANTKVNSSNGQIEIPLYGQIAAGTPIEALRDRSQTIDVPPSLIGSGDHYALEIDGDSMIEAGIEDGDTVLIKKCNNAENGTIVVALLNDNEVTLKKIQNKGNTIALEPANSLYETKYFKPGEIQVQGKLVGLFRKY